MQKDVKYILTVENLSKIYKGSKHNGGKKLFGSRAGEASTTKKALDNVSLSIPKGSVYGLLGSNGAGKSTLINILAGITVKTGGKVTVNGIDQDKDPRGTRFALGVVPQEVVLDPFFTVTETLEFYAGYFGVPKEKRRTKELIDALYLTDKAHEVSRRLSGGMKRRVLIAKALVHNPPLLILDEPTAGVDVELRTQLWDYVRELNRQGTTILLTTHYLEEAENLCDYIAIIDHGKVIVDDSTSALVGRLDRKQLTVVFEEEVAAVPKGLDKFEAKLLDSHSVVVEYKVSEVNIDSLLRAIRRAKLTVRDISTCEPDLEDIFRHLVNKAA